MAGDYPGRPDGAARRCVRFGCLDRQRPQGGELAACEADLDVLLNDALARVPPDSSVRLEVWRA